MPVSYEVDPATGEVVRKGQLGSGQYVPPANPAPAAKPRKPRKSWWSKAINDVRYELDQLRTNPGRSLQRAAKNVISPPPIVRAPSYVPKALRPVVERTTSGVIRQLSPLLRIPGADLAPKAAVLGTLGAINNIRRNQIEAWQKASGRPVDYSLNPMGRNTDRFESEAYRMFGFTPPEEMTDAERNWREAGNALALNTGIALTTGGLGAFGAATRLGKIGRFIGAEALAEIPSTFLDDNTGGSASSFVNMIPGVNVPEPVKPGMDRIEAAGAAFVPNLALGLAVPTAIKGASMVLDQLPAIKRARKAARINAERQGARKALEDAGIEERNPDTGEVRFTPEAAGEKPPSVAEADAAMKQALGIEEEAPKAEPAPEAAPQKSTALSKDIGPETGDVKEDVWDTDFDPTLTEADTAKLALRELDPDELLEVAEAERPIQRMQEILDSRGPIEPDPALRVSLTGAPSDSLSTPLNPYEAQWANLSNEQLRSVASPLNSPELFDEISNLTGREWEEFTRTDILEGLGRLRERGITVIPSRLKGDARVVPVDEIQVDPLRFQFKQGVNAQGQQKGNSLEGVTRWNTDMEGVIQVWTDPKDSKTYVVNGHNRLAKARELGVPSLEVKELLATTPEQARAMGALSNIAQGGGTVYDAAKFLRDSGITDPAQLEAMGVPPMSGHGRQGLALARLPGNIFQAAIDGEVSLGKAVAMGESGLEEPALQEAWKALRNTDMNDSVFREVLAQAGSAPVVKAPDGGQGRLPWDNDDFISLMRQKAELSVQVERLLRKKGKVFGNTAESAEDLAQVGNRIDVGATDEVAQRARLVLDGFRRDKYMAGTPISELLNQGAQQMADGAQAAPLARRISQQMLEASEGMEVPRNAGTAAQGADIPSRAAGEPEARWEQLTPEKRDQFAEQARKDLLTDRKRANREKKAAAVKEQEARHLEWMDDETALKQGQLSQEDYEAKWGPADAEEPPVYKPKNAEYKPIQELERDESARRYLDWYERKKELEQAAEMTPEMREAAENQALVKGIQAGELRPSAAPTVDAPTDSGVDLVNASESIARGEVTPDVLRLAEDEQRLDGAFREADAALKQEQTKDLRNAIGYEELPWQEQKKVGALDGWEVNTTDMAEVARSDLNVLGLQMSRLTSTLPADTVEAIRSRGMPRLEDLIPPETMEAVKRDLDAVMRGDLQPLSPELQDAGRALRAFWGLDEAPPLPTAITEPIGRQLPNGEWAFSAKDRNRVMDQFQVDPQALANKVDAVVDYVQESSTSVKKWVVREPGDDWKIIQRAGNEKRAYELAEKINQRNRDQAVELVRQARQAEIEQAGFTGRLRTPQQPFILSAELAKSDPRYGGATLRFESDLDRAAYVLAADKRTKASKAAPKFRAELEAAGFDPDEIAKYGAEVKQRVKDTAKAKFGSAMASRAKGELFIATGKGPQVDASMSDFEYRSGSGWEEVGGSDEWAPNPPSGELLDLMPSRRYEVAYDGPTPSLEEQQFRVELRQTLTEEIRRIAGDEVEIETFGGRVFMRRPAAWGGGGEVSTSGGWYDPMLDMIRVNEVLVFPEMRLRRTAWHESFHRIQWNLLTPKDMEVMQSLAGMFRTVIGGRRGGPIALSELQAVAFERYATARHLGQDPHQAIFREFGLSELQRQAAESRLAKIQKLMEEGKPMTGLKRRMKIEDALIDALDAAMPILGRIYDFFERFNNLLHRRGWKSVQSVFEDAYTGRLAKKNADLVGTMDEADFSAVTARMRRWRETMLSIDVDRMKVERDMLQLRQTALEIGC